MQWIPEICKHLINMSTPKYISKQKVYRGHTSNIFAEIIEHPKTELWSKHVIYFPFSMQWQDFSFCMMNICSKKRKLFSYAPYILESKESLSSDRTTHRSSHINNTWLLDQGRLKKYKCRFLAQKNYISFHILSLPFFTGIINFV